MKLNEEFAYHQVGDRELISYRHVNGNGFELILVLHGKGKVLIFDRTYPLQDGTLLLIDSAYPHCIHPTDRKLYERDKLIVDRSYLSNLMRDAGCYSLLEKLTRDHGGRCLYLNEEQVQKADRIYMEMHKKSGKSTEEQAFTQAGCVFLLLQYFLEEEDTNEEFSPKDEELASFLSFLKENCTENLTIEEIAEHFHISKYYLCHRFHRQIGMTVMQYLNEQRFALTKKLLVETDLPVSTIGVNCGFCSSSHFCTAFQHHEGMAPNAYRRKMRG